MPRMEEMSACLLRKEEFKCSKLLGLQRRSTMQMNSNSSFMTNLKSTLNPSCSSTSSASTSSGEFEFYVNKADKNVVLNKFYAKGKVMKDSKKALELLMTTNEQPYKFELFAPALLGNVKPGMTEAKISLAHNPGQSLEMKTNFQKFTGFK